MSMLFDLFRGGLGRRPDPVPYELPVPPQAKEGPAEVEEPKEPPIYFSGEQLAELERRGVSIKVHKSAEYFPADQRWRVNIESGLVTVYASGKTLAKALDAAIARVHLHKLLEAEQ